MTPDSNDASDRLLFVVSGPSGSGKETVIAHLIQVVPELERITTFTTRPMRPGESEGKPYHFVSDAEFEHMLEAGELCESERVYGSFRYGSPREVLTGRTHGDVIIELDPNGYRYMKRSRSAPTVGIFLLVPDLTTLSERITRRYPEADVAARLETARTQILEAGDYDYLLLNDDRESCLRQAEAICAAERVKRQGRRSLRAFQALADRPETVD
jgi:guanylate kinase